MASAVSPSPSRPPAVGESATHVATSEAKCTRASGCAQPARRASHSSTPHAAPSMTVPRLTLAITAGDGA